MERTRLERDLTRFLAAIADRGADCDPLVVEPPASEEEVLAVEQTLGRPLPQSVRHFVRTTTTRIRLWWHLDDDPPLPPPLDGLFCGDVHFGLAAIPAQEEGRISWRDECFPNREDPYDAVWHDKTGLFAVGNGDLVAADPDGRIVYLSHDGSDEHGALLAPSLEELFRQWAPLGCPGPEDWQWGPFCVGDAGIRADSPAAAVWLEWVGVARPERSLPGQPRLQPGRELGVEILQPLGQLVHAREVAQLALHRPLVAAQRLLVLAVLDGQAGGLLVGVEERAVGQREGPVARGGHQHAGAPLGAEDHHRRRAVHARPEPGRQLAAGAVDPQVHEPVAAQVHLLVVEPVAERPAQLLIGVQGRLVVHEGADVVDVLLEPGSELRGVHGAECRGAAGGFVADYPFGFSLPVGLVFLPSFGFSFFSVGLVFSPVGFSLPVGSPPPVSAGCSGTDRGTVIGP